MNMQAVLIRGAILLAMCFGLSVAMLHNQPVSGTVVTTTAVAMAAKATPREAVTTVVLPTVSVRPSAKELALAMRGDDDDSDNAATFIDVVAKDPPLRDGAATLRSLHLDMPYYSFGKALPRVSKE